MVVDVLMWTMWVFGFLAGYQVGRHRKFFFKRVRKFLD